MAKLSPFPKELHYDSQKISSNISHRKDKEGSLHAPNQILNYDLILVKFEKNMLSLIIQDALFRVNFFDANFNQFDWMLKIFDQSKCVKIALRKIFDQSKCVKIALRKIYAKNLYRIESGLFFIH